MQGINTISNTLINIKNFNDRATDKVETKKFKRMLSSMFDPNKIPADFEIADNHRV